ncbi:MAG: AEC family transporter [Methanobacterium sp.]|uniref:AEC family transporter n=1 Tax=Methanobacterium sp. TaxID=2164 RepID=UPI003C712806
MNSTETILAIILLILIGYVSKRIGLLKPEDSYTLNKIVINIAIPSLIFLAMFNADLSNLKILLPITLICIITGSLCGLLVYLFSRARGYSKKTKWTLVGTSTLFNSGFLGYPVVLGVFGATGLVRAVFYDMGSTILFLCLGILFILIFGGKYTSIIKRTLLFPPLWGIILGIIANILHLNLGYIPLNVLKYLSGAAIPLIMISLGLSLEVGDLKDYFGAASFVTLTRLIISPMIAILMVYILGLHGLEGTVTVVEAGMPSAMLSLVLAASYDLDINAAAACIFLSTVVSMITLPILISLI